MDEQVKSLVKKTINDITAHKAVAKNNKINEIMANEINPKIAENEKTFKETWDKARQLLNEQNEKLRSEGKIKAESLVEAEYSKTLETLNLIIGEE